MFFLTFFVKKWSFLGVLAGGLEGVDFGPFLGVRGNCPGVRFLTIFDYFFILSFLIYLCNTLFAIILYTSIHKNDSNYYIYSELDK